MAPSQLIPLGPRQIACEDPVGPTGDRLPVVLIHGSSVHRAIWAPLVEALRRDYRPISFDHPGHGDSSLPAAASVEALAGVLEALLAALAIERLALIGFSLGGAVAQLFHARHSPRVAALGLISTAPNFALPEEVIARWRADPIAYAEDEAALSIAPMSPQTVRERIARLREGVSAEGQAADLAACADWDAPAAEPSAGCPLLLMSASHDIPRLREQAERWVRANPEARLAIIPQAGHFMLVEQPDACAAAVLDWLKRLTP